MSYLKQIWRDSVSGGTTLTADRLNHMEDGIAAANDAWDSVTHAPDGEWTRQNVGGVVRYTKMASKSFSFGTAGAVYASGTLTETYPARASSVIAVSVSLCDPAKDGWVGCVDAGGEGVNFKFFSWFNLGATATRKFSVAVDVLP